MEAFGYCDVFTDDGINFFLELSRVGGLKKDAHFVGLQLFFKCLVATSAMWVEYLFRFGIALPHGVCYLLVGVSGAADKMTNLFV